MKTKEEIMAIFSSIDEDAQGKVMAELVVDIRDALVSIGEQLKEIDETLVDNA